MLLLTALIIFTGALVSWNVETRPREYFVLLLLLVTGVFGVFAARRRVPAVLLLRDGRPPDVPAHRDLGQHAQGLLGDEAHAVPVRGQRGAHRAAGAHVLAGRRAHVRHARVGRSTPSAPAFQHWVFLLALLGFGTLIPIWPLHTWSPDGHVAAPTAVSMLHAGVLLKLGAYGLIRLGLDAVPARAGPTGRWLICVIGVINIVYGAFCAMNQTDLKYVIGYSSVSHMGYVLLGIGDRRTSFGLDRRRVPDVRARHHDGAVLRAHRLRLREDAHAPDRRDLRAHAAQRRSSRRAS